MEALVLNLGSFFIQVITLVLLVGLPLILALLAYRWMLQIQQRLTQLEERLQSLDWHLEEVLDYLAEQEEGA